MSGGIGSGGGELTHGGRQGDAGGAQRQARGGAGRRAQDETLPVLFDLGLGQRVEVGEDLGPGRRLAAASPIAAMRSSSSFFSTRARKLQETWPRMVSSSL